MHWRGNVPHTATYNSSNTRTNIPRSTTTLLDHIRATPQLPHVLHVLYECVPRVKKRPTPMQTLPDPNLHRATVTVYTHNSMHSLEIRPKVTPHLIRSQLTCISDRNQLLTWFGLDGMSSGCARRKRCEKVVPKYAPSMLACRVLFG